ncbi:MAG TPA: peptidylprolyl isomerase [Tepidisphaeraceae bacterium]|jgi:hypothetical protein|nr:peptidylprolyl isomerase [Tepidisphaeraceae bacterium]
MKNAHHISKFAAASFMITAIGCGAGGGGPKELAPDQFYRSEPPGTIESRHVLADRPGVMYNDLHVDAMDKSPQDPFHLKEEKPQQPSVTAISSPSSELAQMSSTQPVNPPATQRLTEKPSSGGYMTVGAVVVEINGKPIYADKVLKSLDAEFAAEAKQRDEQSFRVFAAGEIQKQVYHFISDELIYAQAENTLDKQEKDLAWQLTGVWRDQQKTQSNGSIQEARAKFAADGTDLDDAAQEKYRQTVTAIYIEKKIRPKIQVTVQNMREYYEKHLATEFSDPDTVQYRLIKIDVAKSGSRPDALKRIKDISDRAAKGEDFQSLASQFNDDERLARAGGLEAPIQRGALRNEKLNDAVFSTQQGHLTNIIDAGDAFYLAKIESVKNGRTQPFDDPTVQHAIKDAITKEQMQPLLDVEREKLRQNGVIVPDPPLIDPVMEMAMQKYPQWAAAK